MAQNSRGNAAQEIYRIFKQHEVRIEAENTGVFSLLRAFEKVMARPRRKVPKLRRPKETLEKRALKKGQISLFYKP